MTERRVPRRVLVTGAGGLIGSAVCRLLRSRGVAVTALVLDDPGDLAADRVVVGDAGDPGAVRDAVAGCDAVAHFAARPSPLAGTPVEVFAGNTRATFVVLEEAGRAGVRRMVLASSYGVLGLPWAARELHPCYLPVDEQHPTAVEDPYGLSKVVDEQTGAMVARRYGASVTALRFPFVGDDERLARRLQRTLDDPGAAAADLWAHLHVRDAAEVTWCALLAALPGCTPLFVAAPRTLAPWPTAALLAAHHPGTPVRAPLPGRAVAIDVSAARASLGFAPRHGVELEERPWPHSSRVRRER